MAPAREQTAQAPPTFRTQTNRLHPQSNASLATRKMPLKRRRSSSPHAAASYDHYDLWTRKIGTTSQGLPTELQEYVTSVLSKRPDQTLEPRSPNARRIRSMHRSAVFENKATNINNFSRLLFFSGEDDKTNETPTPKITTKLNIDLAPEFFPPPKHGCMYPLSEPCPDILVGYLTNLQAEDFNPQLDTAFTNDEESKLGLFKLHPIIHFPFLSSQWEGIEEEPHIIAKFRAARDGATIVHYLDEFYKKTQNQNTSYLDCSHLSVTCKPDFLEIWMHWREPDSEQSATYYMERIHYAFTSDDRALEKVRGMLKNHLEYALGSRVQSLKEALAKLEVLTERRFWNLWGMIRLKNDTRSLQ